MKRLRSCFPATPLFFALAVAQVAAAPPQAESPAESDDAQIVARVNDIPITKGQVRQRVQIYEIAHPGLAPGEARTRRAGVAVQVLVQGVLEELLAKEMGLTVTEAEVEAKYASMKGKQDERTFATMLKFQGNDPENLRGDLRRALVNEKLMKKLSDAIVVTESDLKARFEQDKRTMFPEQVKARQIIVLTEDLARQLHKQIKEGADFAELARSTSTERSSKDNGGDLGWVLRGTGHYPPWDDIVFKMKPGEVSQPFETVHGWHIVKVEGYRPVGWGKLEDKRDLMTGVIRKQRAYAELQRRVEDLKKRVKLWVADRIELDAPTAAMNQPKAK